MPRQKGFSGYQEDNELYKEDGDCEHMRYIMDKTVGWKRWYCDVKLAFLFDTQECDALSSSHCYSTKMLEDSGIV